MTRALSFRVQWLEQHATLDVCVLSGHTEFGEVRESLLSEEAADLFRRWRGRACDTDSAAPLPARTLRLTGYSVEGDEAHLELTVTRGEYIHREAFVLRRRAAPFGWAVVDVRVFGLLQQMLPPDSVRRDQSLSMRDSAFLSLSERARLLEIVWREREQVVDDRTELHRRGVYLYLDRRPDFEQHINVRVREALGGDTVDPRFENDQSQRTRRWIVDSVARLADGRAVLSATLVYPPRGHRERYWLRESAVAPGGWSLDSVTFSRWVYM